MEKMVIAPVILFLCALFAPPALAQTADSEVGAKAAQLAAEGKVLADEAQKLESIAKKIGKTARELQQQANIKKDIANVLDNIVGKWKCTRRFNYKYKYDNDRKHLFSVETFVFDNSFAFRRSGDLQSYILIEEKREIGGDDYLFRAMATVAFIFSSDREGYWNAAENEGQIQLLLNGGGQWKVKDKPQVGVSISKSEYWLRFLGRNRTSARGAVSRNPRNNKQDMQHSAMVERKLPKVIIPGGGIIGIIQNPADIRTGKNNRAAPRQTSYLFDMDAKNIGKKTNGGGGKKIVEHKTRQITHRASFGTVAENENAESEIVVCHRHNIGDKNRNIDIIRRTKIRRTKKNRQRINAVRHAGIPNPGGDKAQHAPAKYHINPRQHKPSSATQNARRQRQNPHNTTTAQPANGGAHAFDKTQHIRANL